jgi:dTDP-4-dehydrorhamnose 3,5-epimerase
MIFKETKLKGAYIIEPEKLEDDRGFFARTFCKNEFKKNNLNFEIVQTNTSYNKFKGTLRGMHYQSEPKAETKLLTCTKGAIYDVIVDLRKDSSTYLNWTGVELSEENKLFLFIPKGFAQGFQTLKDNTEIFYYMDEFYSPEHANGIRYNDPKLNIKWPIENPILSEKDKNWELW